MTETKSDRMAEVMRRDWDERARKDAYFYIASWRKDWDEASFFQSGEEDYQRLVSPSLDRFQFVPAGKTMLELGCGAGRMTRTFARNFSRTFGFDVSAEMLERARNLNRSIENISWVQGNGSDLSNIASASVQFVFSYLVLQHLPAENLVHSYVREILRVLGDGGVCLFQFNGSSEKYMNWRGRLAWSVIDSLWAMRLSGASRFIANSLGMDPEMAGNSWHGVGMNAENVAQTVRSSGGTVLELSGIDTPMAWCCARKTSALAGAPAI
ncbi:MAG: class I SAM-dependent methyltransferase [Candidatus Acidiferrales bacterium]